MRLSLLLLVTAMLLMRGAAVSHCAMWNEGWGNHLHGERPHVHISWPLGRTCVTEEQRSPCCHHAPVPCEHGIAVFVSDDDLPRLQSEAGARLSRCDASLVAEMDGPAPMPTGLCLENGVARPPSNRRSGLASRPHQLRV